MFLPLLYEFSVGTASATEVTPKYSDLLKGSGIEFIKGFVTSVQFEEKQIEIQTISNDNNNNNNNSEKKFLKFDKIVIAVGIQPKLDMIPG